MTQTIKFLVKILVLHIIIIFKEENPDESKILTMAICTTTRRTIR